MHRSTLNLTFEKENPFLSHEWKYLEMNLMELKY